jgi:RNA polymerase sigma factor FliA
MAQSIPKTPSPPAFDRRKAAVRYYPFIRQVARRMARRLPTHVALDDIVSAGVVGLMDCLDKYDPKKSERFETYAEFRIKGAMLDELRSADPLSRDQRASVNALRDARHALEGRFGRAPEPEELAEELGCDLDHYHAVIARVAASRTVVLDEGLSASDSIGEQRADPSVDACYGERRTYLAHAIARLPPRLRMVVTLYYFEDLSLKEIGRVLGVTESRICQLHGQAMRLLRELLESESEK